MSKRLALIGDHICDWIDYEEVPLQVGEVRFRTELASGKYGTWAATLDQATFGDQVLDPGTRMFVSALSSTSSRAREPVSRANPMSFGTSAVGVVSEVGLGIGG